MNLEEYDKAIKELENEIEDNNKIKDIYVERFNLARFNTTEFRAINLLVLSTLPYLIISLIIATSMASGAGLVALLPNIPTITLPLGVAAVSTGIGAIGNLVLDKFRKTKRYKEFSTATNEEERLSEQIYYDIESEKLYNRNKALQKAIESLRTNKKLASTLPNKPKFNYDTYIASDGALKNRINEIDSILKTEFESLDKQSAKSILHNFWPIRQKSGRRERLFINTLLAFWMSMMLLMPYTGFGTHVINFSLSSIFVVTGISSIGTYAYLLRRNNIFKKVFNKFNSQLGEDGLINEFNKNYGALDEEKEISQSIEKKISDISLISSQLYEEKSLLNNIQDSDSDEKDKTVDDIQKEDTVYYSNVFPEENDKLENTVVKKIGTKK